MASSTSSFRTLLVLAVLNVSIWCALATNSCYFPDGDTASSYVPCSPNGDGGCCLSGDFCTSLGYCISDSKGYHYRGACTDSTWFNPSCPDYCLTNANSGNSSSVNIIACNAATTGGSWCCAYNNTNCCDTDSTYIPTFGTIFAEPGTSSTSSAASTGSTSISSSASTTSSASATTTSAVQALQTSSVPTPSSSNKGTVIGAAVGVPLGLVAIAALALYFRERRRRQKTGPEVPEKPQVQYQYYGGSITPSTDPSQPLTGQVGPMEHMYQNTPMNPPKMHELSSAPVSHELQSYPAHQ